MDNQEQAALSEFEAAHSKFETQLHQYLAQIRDSVSHLWRSLPAEQYDTYVRSLVQWSQYMQKYNVMAAQLKQRGRSDLSNRLAALQAEIAKLIEIFRQDATMQRSNRDALHGARLQAGQDWFDGLQTIHNSTNDAYATANAAWEKYLTSH